MENILLFKFSAYLCNGKYKCIIIFQCYISMREEILDTSLQRFLKFGIRKMTIQKLVEPLGISTKTVYKYFSDKEALLKECLAVHYARLLEGITEMEDHANAVQAMQNL